MRSAVDQDGGAVFIGLSMWTSGYDCDYCGVASQYHMQVQVPALSVYKISYHDLSSIFFARLLTVRSLSLPDAYAGTDLQADDQRRWQ